MRPCHTPLHHPLKKEDSPWNSSTSASYTPLPSQMLHYWCTLRACSLFPAICSHMQYPSKQTGVLVPAAHINSTPKKTYTKPTHKPQDYRSLVQSRVNSLYSGVFYDTGQSCRPRRKQELVQCGNTFLVHSKSFSLRTLHYSILRKVYDP